MQIEKTIRITQIQDIYDFVHKASLVDGDVLVKKNSYCIDGTSLLGMFSIDTTNPVTVSYPADAIEFAEFVKIFEVK